MSSRPGGFILGCPVCRASFRGEVTCSRCGADLQAVMTIAASAYRLRRAASAAILSNDAQRAERLAAEAQAMLSTPSGRRLLVLARVLARGFGCLLAGGDTRTR